MNLASRRAAALIALLAGGCGVPGTVVPSPAPEPVTSPPAPSIDACGWCDDIPPSADGDYFCGVSPPAPAEVMARDLAMQNAHAQVVKFMGVYLSTLSTSEASLIKGYLEDKQVTTAAAIGIAAQVKATRWCKPTPLATPEGWKYTSKVLAFLPKGEKSQAARSVVDAMLTAAEKQEEKPAQAPPAKPGPKPTSPGPSRAQEALRQLLKKVP